MDAVLSFIANPFAGSRDDTTQWVILGVGVIATLWLVLRPRSQRKRDPMGQLPAMSLSQQRQLERDMNHLMVEMLETARQIAAQLETRAAKITVLLEEADQKLQALRQATGESPSAMPVLPSGPSPSPTAQAPASPADEPPAHAPPAEPPETPPDPRYAEIYAMADQGRSPNEIARSLNRPNGEVELILALRRH